ncbi:DUF5385 family protein [[Mycoplasma] cavipharyngis]|uniref:DUF5385 family protein n=1 Tax=[Mycoplasma] cavipharyngis TaxID=92757 RepID=UPI003704BE5E
MNSAFIVIVFVIAAVLFFFVKKKKSNAKSNELDKRSGGQKRDEVWRTIKEYLRSQNLKGFEIVSTYSIQRPKPKELHKRLKQALIFDAKQIAKKNKTKYVAPKILDKFPLETYFEKLAEETYAISQVQRETFATESINTVSNNALLHQKSHRIDLTKKNNSKKFVLPKINFTFWKKKDLNETAKIQSDRERYVLIFRVKNSRTQELLEPRAIEVEILKNFIDKKTSHRKIIINKELDLEKEMAWIKPIKHLDDKRAIEDQKRALRQMQKDQLHELKKRNQELWHQKVFPEATRKKVRVFIAKLKTKK